MTDAAAAISCFYVPFSQQKNDIKLHSIVSEMCSHNRAVGKGAEYHQSRDRESS